jgi:uroporphyrinogen decarboxylase
MDHDAGMTHRERVMAALSHRRPDKVPIDLGSTRDSSVVVEGYERLAERFGVGAGAALTSRMMRVVDIDERILRGLDIDTRGVFPAGPPDQMMGDRGYRDEWGVERTRPDGAFYYDQVKYPLAGPIGVQDIARYRWPDPQNPVRIRGLRERIREIRAGTDCAIVLNLPSAFVHTSQYLRGFEDWFVDIAADLRLSCYLFDAVLEVSLGMISVNSSPPAVKIPSDPILTRPISSFLSAAAAGAAASRTFLANMSLTALLPRAMSWDSRWPSRRAS